MHVVGTRFKRVTFIADIFVNFSLPILVPCVVWTRLRANMLYYSGLPLWIGRPILSDSGPGRKMSSREAPDGLGYVHA